MDRSAATLADRLRWLLGRLETPAWVGLAVALLAWVLIVVFSEPYGRLWGTGQDARSYWAPILSDPYRNANWTTPVAYPYSPVFLQVLEPIRLLPWQAFIGAWTAILLAGVRFLTGPRLFAAGVAVAAMELAGGNISILLAVGIVIGFGFAGTWALALLTKVTPGVGLLWFLVRREWRALAVAGVVTGLVFGLSYLTMPGDWHRWVEVLLAIHDRQGTWAAVPIPLVVRFPAAVVLIAWGARTDRRWTLVVGTMIALPALWYGAFSMLLALIWLDRHPRQAEGDRRGSAELAPSVAGSR